MSPLTFAMTFAVVGWVASSYAIKRSTLASHWQRRLILPLWFVWLALALGGPVLNGSLLLTEAVSTAAASTAGMFAYLFFGAIRSRKSS